MPAFLLLAVLMLVILGECHGGEVYKVGDSSGWTIIGNINYTAWSSSKSFHLGDTILFEYNKQFHNVVEVSKTDYRTCNASNPISTHNSGNDSVLLNHKGHFFFLCGVARHCQIGQKVDIRIPKNDSVGPVGNNTLLPTPPASSPVLPLGSRGFRIGRRLALGIYGSVMIGFGA
ncbi:Early nodulin-like protein [Zostera marina]|uniref:Early nodulin-like protein n=1 Tax=Zostera marina TaxID=29655 RepID=A0A0K9P6C2_ZOSMR|nr:Early nodulin-like protein [Zostera marina]